MHDVVIVGVPLFAILAGILFSRSDVKDFRSDIKDVRNEGKDTRSDIKELRSELLDRLNVLEADMRQFYHLTGGLKGRLDSIEKR